MENIVGHDFKYEKSIREYFEAQLPAKMFDAHFHIWTEYPPVPEGETPFSVYKKYLTENIGDRVVGGLLMPKSAPKGNADTHTEENNLYALKTAKEQNFAAGFLVTPTNTREALIKTLDENPQIKALKPHLYYSLAQDPFESDILDFAPEWVWQVAEERELPVVIHISHYQNTLYDENNVRQIRLISKKYPNAKIVLAHCGLGYNVRKTKLGLQQLSDLKNIWFDCSGAPAELSIYYCMKYFGVERVMWGDDYFYGSMYGRARELGSNYIGMHEDEIDTSLQAVDFKYQPFLNLWEGILSALEACELMGLDAKGREAVFYENGMKLYGTAQPR